MDGCHFQILLDALSDLVSVYCTKMVEPTADMVSVLNQTLYRRFNGLYRVCRCYYLELE